MSALSDIRPSNVGSDGVPSLRAVRREDLIPAATTRNEGKSPLDVRYFVVHRVILTAALLVNRRPALGTCTEQENRYASCLSVRCTNQERWPRAYSQFLTLFFPRPGHSGFSHVRIVPGDAVGRRVFSEISRFPPPFHSGAAPYSPQSPSSAIETSRYRDEVLLNRRNWRFEISNRDQQPSSTNWERGRGELVRAYMASSGPRDRCAKTTGVRGHCTRLTSFAAGLPQRTDCTATPPPGVTSVGGGRVTQVLPLAGTSVFLTSSMTSHRPRGGTLTAPLHRNSLEDAGLLSMIILLSFKYNWLDGTNGGRGGAVASAPASHLGDPGSITGRFAPGFSHVGIMLDDAAVRRAFSGNSSFHRPCIPAPLHPRVSLHVMFRDDGHLRVPAGKPVTRRVLPRPGPLCLPRCGRVALPVNSLTTSGCMGCIRSSKCGDRARVVMDEQ
ncbi:hypothetical protein PR048_024754 [Dryococelus australis]|uniref:Uncharacterized protein n=1 Tax=Dryococelus australis TaxID=614101 RepID=A0ABQ9GPG8_9NEOP|nr:hypothetical protein PR048_024754 [Dryococelus australis]